MPWTKIAQVSPLPGISQAGPSPAGVVIVSVLELDAEGGARVAAIDEGVDAGLATGDWCVTSEGQLAQHRIRVNVDDPADAGITAGPFEPVEAVVVPGAVALTLERRDADAALADLDDAHVRLRRRVVDLEGALVELVRVVPHRYEEQQRRREQQAKKPANGEQAHRIDDIGFVDRGEE